MKFNSAICTSIEQSRKLLALGLKKETADMYWVNHLDLWMPVMLLHEDRPLDNNDIPAWSLHRLMVLAEMKGSAFLDLDVAYETTISVIAAKIRFGYFNEEYLVNQAEIEEHCKGVLEYLDYIRGEED